jgi:hypothetical protein
MLGLWVIMKYVVYLPTPNYEVDIPFSLEIYNEAELWCDDHTSTIRRWWVFNRPAKYSRNIVFSSVLRHHIRYCFEKEEDAMWFKLRWS